MGVFGYLTAIGVMTTINPALGPRGERLPFMQRFRALGRVWGVLLLFVVVMGGIYAGIFTPTEAAGIGASGAFLFALSRRSLNPASFLGVLVDSVKTTSMIFFVLIGALMFSNFINLVGLPTALLELVSELSIPPMGVILIILLFYLVLGCVLESLSMVLLTVPIFFPLVQNLGFDLIWFGIIVVVVTEISLITPPVGLNVFVLKATMPELPASTIFRGVTPFWIADVFRLTFLVFLPWISLALPWLLGHQSPF